MRKLLKIWCYFFGHTPVRKISEGDYDHYYECKICKEQPMTRYMEYFG